MRYTKRKISLQNHIFTLPQQRKYTAKTTNIQFTFSDETKINLVNMLCALDF